MSQDFVRQMPNSNYVFQRTAGIGDRVHLDLTMLTLLFCISVYGLVILYSALDQNQAALTSQAIKMGVAAVGMVVMAQISPIFYLRLAPFMYIGGVLLLILVYPFGYEVNGSKRWIRIPGLFGFQPSEIMKLVLPMILAWYFHDRHLPPKNRHIFWALVIIAIPVVLIMGQPDLGTSLIIGASGLLVLLLAGIPWRFVYTAIGLAVLSAPAMWFFVLRGYQQERILTLFNPERDPLGAGWNIIQSKTAIGSGGIFGKGLFEGTQSHLDFLPESQTDFIIAVLAEAGRRDPADHVPAAHGAGCRDLHAGAGHLWPPAVGHHHVYFFCLCFCQHWHGLRHPAGGGCALADRESRRYLHPDFVCRIRGDNVYPYASEDHVVRETAA